jgi:hypothetical protein
MKTRRTTEFLPTPQVLQCCFEDSMQPHVPAMALRWDADAPGAAERTWYLPHGVCVQGHAPEKFGVTIQRLGTNCYRVRVIWNELYLCWNQLTRVEIMTSALAPLLRALGTDLWYLLEQPIEPVGERLARAA